MADEPLSRVGKGDPITADWANAVADAINGRGASDPNANGTATPYGIMTPADVDTQMRAPDAQAMPFDAAIIREGSDGDALYMALPNAPDYVFDGTAAVSPDSAQTMGTAQNAFVRIEAVTNGSARYVSLALTPPDTSTTPPIPPKWRLFVAASPTSRPSWADPARPVVLLAGYNIASDDPSGTDAEPGDVPSLLKGLVQYHRGTINLDSAKEVPDTEATPTGGKPGMSIERYRHAGTGTDDADGALQIYKFPDDATMDFSASLTSLDDIFHFVVRDRTATRRKVNYVKPSDVFAGTFTAVTDVGIGSVSGVSGTCFYVEKTTFKYTGRQFVVDADVNPNPARTCLFKVDDCAEGESNP